MNTPHILWMACAALLAIACNRETTHTPPAGMPAQTSPPPAIERTTARMIRTLPHDTMAFTQGLVVDKGTFVETTGLNGMSTIRRVDIATGRVKARTSLNVRYFGEGVTVLGGKAYMLTWQNMECLVFDVATLKQTGSFRYSGEGWGITNDGTHLYMSDGSDRIKVIDPVTFGTVRTVAVTLDGQPVRELNELEWIDGELWANVWRTDVLARIDPASGRVTGVVDCSGLLPAAERTPSMDVLNGIAWDSAAKALYVTGKNWPHVYQIERP